LQTGEFKLMNSEFLLKDFFKEMEDIFNPMAHYKGLFF
jgi:hypothetical protein